MKNIRKLFTLLLVIVMSCAMLLTSCKKKNGKDDGEENIETEAVKYEKPINLWIDDDSYIMENGYNKSGRLVATRFTCLSDGESTVLNYTYDNSGKITKLSYQWSFFYPVTELYFVNVDGVSYAAGGKVEYYENGAVKNVCIDDFADVAFDKNGRVTSIYDYEELTLIYEGNSKNPVLYEYDGDEIEVNYNEKGYISSLSCDGEVLVAYTYDKNGNVATESIFDDDCVINECQYDSKNNRTKITKTEYEDASKTEINEKSVKEFTYNSKNMIVSAVATDYYDGEEKDKINISFEYDSNDRMTKAYRNYGEETYVVEYQYDSNGRPYSGIMIYYGSNGEVEYKQTVTKEYDSLNRVIKLTAMGYEGDALVSKDVEEYEYDNKCRETKQTRTEYGKNGAFEGKVVYETTYDANGVATETITEYDENGNIIDSSANNDYGSNEW